MKSLQVDRPLMRMNQDRRRLTVGRVVTKQRSGSSRGHEQFLSQDANSHFHGLPWPVLESLSGQAAVIIILMLSINFKRRMYSSKVVLKQRSIMNI